MSDPDACVYSIYIHTTPSNKMYVGITCKKPEHRWQQGNGYKHNPAFNNAILKYGWNNIKHEVVATRLSENTAKALEIELIVKYRTQNRPYGYNITAGGDGVSGYQVSEATRAKLSANHKGKRHSEATKAKMSNARKGVHISDKVKANMSKAQKGRQITESTRQKISVSLKGHKLTDNAKTKISICMKGNTHTLGYKHSNEAKAKMSASKTGKQRTGETKSKIGIANTPLRDVYQYSFQGELIKVWESLALAVKIFRLGQRSGSIMNCITGRAKSAYGYYWQYANNI